MRTWKKHERIKVGSCSLNGVQAQFVKVTRENCGHNLRIWYGGKTTQRGQDKCLKFAFEWMQEIASHPDTIFTGASDYRIKHWERINPTSYKS